MIDDLKKLEKFLSICSKNGVTKINWGGVDCELGPRPLTTDEIKEANTPELSDEQLAFLAVDGV